MNKFFIAKSKADEWKAAAYRHAIKNAKQEGVTYAQAAWDAFTLYNVTVLADTIREKI